MKAPRKKLNLYLLASVLLAFAGLGWAQEPAEEEKPRLEIVRLDLLDHFAKYPVDPESVFEPGEVVNVAFNLRGYEVSDDYRIKLNWNVKTSGPGGLPFAPGKEGSFDSELAPEDDEWEPLVRYEASLPYHLPAGLYKIEIEAQDELSGVTAQGHLDVRVAGKSGILQSDVLSVQNFTFSLTAGGTPLRAAVFRPGGTIFASFDITGYKLGEGNSYELTSRLELLNAEGERVYAFNPANEKGSSFYPRLSLPANFQFNLDPTIEPGFYTLFLNVNDIVGTQSFSMQQPLEVR